MKYVKDSKVCYGQSSLKAPTIWRLRGGDGWLGLGKNFLAYNGVRFIFSALYTLKDIFFTTYFLARTFFPRNQSGGYFFPEITHTRSKVKWSATKQTPLGKRKKVSMTENVAYCKRTVLQAVSQSRILSISFLVQVHCIRKLHQH